MKKEELRSIAEESKESFSTERYNSSKKNQLSNHAKNALPSKPHVLKVWNDFGNKEDIEQLYLDDWNEQPNDQ